MPSLLTRRWGISLTYEDQDDLADLLEDMAEQSVYFAAAISDVPGLRFHLVAIIVFPDRVSVDFFWRLGINPNKCLPIRGSMDDALSYLKRDGAYFTEWFCSKSVTDVDLLSYAAYVRNNGMATKNELRAFNPNLYHEYGRALIQYKSQVIRGEADKTANAA